MIFKWNKWNKTSINFTICFFNNTVWDEPPNNNQRHLTEIASPTKLLQWKGLNVITDNVINKVPKPV
jgi:hypothetical protein